METGKKSDVGWTSIDGVRVPYVVRDNRKFVSVRLLETTLLANYQHVGDSELHKRAPLISFFMTPAEARALNGTTCGGYSEHDLIVQLADFVLFYGEVKSRYGRPSRTSGGWVQLNSTVMPYVITDCRRLVPLSVVRHAASLLKGMVVDSRKVTPDEIEHLNAMCKKARIPFHFTESTRLVSIDVVVARSSTKVTVFDLPGDDPLSHAYYEYVSDALPQSVPLSLPVSVERAVPREMQPTTVKQPVAGVNLCPQVLNMQYPALGQMLLQRTSPGQPVPMNGRAGPPKTPENHTSAPSEPSPVPPISPSGTRATLNPRSSVVFTQPAPNMVVVPVISQRQMSSPEAVTLGSYSRTLPPGVPRVSAPSASAASPPFAATAANPWGVGYQPNRVDMSTPDAPVPQQRPRKGQQQATVYPPQPYGDITQGSLTERDFQMQMQHHTDQQTQQQKRYLTQQVFVDSICGQIVPVVIHSKTVTCLVNGSGRWVLVEVIARVFFPHVPIPDVERALVTIIGTGLPRINPEQEAMFIRFYRLKTDALAFNTVVRVRELARCLPQLQSLFPATQHVQAQLRQHIEQHQFKSSRALPPGATIPVGDRLQSPASESDSGISVTTTDRSDSVESADVSNGALDLSAAHKRKNGHPADSDAQMCVKRLRAGIEEAVAKLKVKQAFVT